MSATHGFKFEAPDGKLRVADVLNSKGGGVLKKVDSGSGKLGYGFTDLRDNYSDRLHRARVFTPINDTPECRKQLSECRMMQ